MTDMEEKYEKLKDIVEKEMKRVSPAHDINHIMRVYNLCLFLAKDEPNIDLDVLKTAVLLHDIARFKEEEDNSGDTDHATLGVEMAEKILSNLDYPEGKIEQIKYCIISHRFRSENEPKIKEAKVLFDADKLDVLGAIGIARSFIVAGEYGEKIYSNTPINAYIKDNLIDEKLNGRIKEKSKHAPNLEFETKFKYIPDKLYTTKAKEIAKQRLDYMKQFFERLQREISGEL